MTDKEKTMAEEVNAEAKENETNAAEKKADDIGKEAEGKEVKDTEEMNEAEGDNAKSEVSEAEKSEDAEAEEAWEMRCKRLMADFQNYKKRVEKDKTKLYAYANEKIVTELLTVMDNFERALTQEAGEGFKEGMELIFKQMGDVLEKSGLAEINALGEDFDPNVHNAVMTEEPGEYESGKVSGVLQKGYTLNGKVIRAAMVKVVN